MIYHSFLEFSPVQEGGRVCQTRSQCSRVPYIRFSLLACRRNKIWPFNIFRPLPLRQLPSRGIPWGHDLFHERTRSASINRRLLPTHNLTTQREREFNVRGGGKMSLCLQIFTFSILNAAWCIFTTYYSTYWICNLSFRWRFVPSLAASLSISPLVNVMKCAKMCTNTHTRTKKPSANVDE